MKQESKERKVYFKDMLFACLYKWRWLLAAGVVFALLLGGFGVFNAGNTVGDPVSLTPEIQERVDQLQAMLVQTEKNIENQTRYLEESVLMTLDPYEAYSAMLYLFAEPEDTADAEDVAVLLRAYYAHVLDADTVQTLGDAFGIEGKYMAELIRCDSTVEGMLAISVRGTSAEDAKAKADAIRVEVEGQTEHISKSVEKHELTVLAFGTSPKADTALLDEQNAALQKLATLKNTLTSTTTELNKYLPNALVAGDTNPLLYAVIGGILGVFLAVCIAWVSHISSAKVYSARALKDCTGVRILGCVSSGRKRNILDRWLRALEGRVSYGELDAVTANIRNHCAGIKTLLVLGSYEDNALEGLTAELEKEGICCKLCGDPQNSATALRALPDCDAVVLVETCAISRYDNVEWEMETVADHGKTLLGCVLIDG